MKNKYDRAIEYVRITPEMHERIMKNLSDADITKNHTRAPFFRAYRKYISIAACFVLLLVGAVLIYNNLTQKPQIQGTHDIVEYKSLSELSSAVGFKINEVGTLPFTVEQTQYTGYGKNLAQITYSAGDNSLVFRVSVGSEDNSGDYNEYGDIKSCSAGGYNVIIKGDKGLYSLALWEYGGHSYSVSISKGVSKEEMLKIVLSVH